MTSTPNGIPGLRGRQHAQCAVTLGTKAAGGGNPTDTMRFYIKRMANDAMQKTSSAGKTYESLSKPEHPDFADWHAGKIGSRTSLPIKLAHLTEEGAWTHNFKGDIEMPGIPKHPRRGPGCIGNGVVAQRWDGQRYTTIACPGEQCPYQTRTKPNGQPYCGWSMSLRARLVVPTITSRSMEFKSRSKHTILNLLGFFETFREACAGLGVAPAQVPLWGLPLTMSVVQIRKEGKAFPTVQFDVAGSDITEWVSGQLKRAEEARRAAESQPVLVSDEEAEVLPPVDMADVRPGMVR